MPECTEAEMRLIEVTMSDGTDESKRKAQADVFRERLEATGMFEGLVLATMATVEARERLGEKWDELRATANVGFNSTFELQDAVANEASRRLTARSTASASAGVPSAQPAKAEPPA